MTIWAHTLVKNEDKYLWFAVSSVVKYVDKLLLWDTGSTDETVSICELLKSTYPKKIDFRRVVQKDIYDFTLTRQQMLEKTSADWLMILDGDEVWWEAGIARATQTLSRETNKHLETLVTPYFNIVGDIFHYQEEKAGMYQIDGQKGHLNIRFVNMAILGLHFAKPHGTQGLFDEQGTVVQARDKTKRLFVAPSGYLHFTNVTRSTQPDSFVPKRQMKIKYEIGNTFPADFYYPEVFFLPRPDFVPNPWQKMSTKFFFRSLVESPLRRVKRRIVTSSTGY